MSKEETLDAVKTYIKDEVGMSEIHDDFIEGWFDYFYDIDHEVEYIGGSIMSEYDLSTDF